MKKIIIGVSAFLLFCGFAATGFAAGTESLGVDIHGFVSQGFLRSSNYDYLAPDAGQGSFQFDEVGINFSKQVMDNVRIGAQFFARDVGDVANNKITLDWAYGDYRFKDWLGLRAGRIKLPYGLFNEIRDADMLRACIILPQGMYNELNRDSQIAMNGGGLYGTISLPNAGNLEYQALIGSSSIDASSGVGKHISSSFGGAKVGDYTTDTEWIGSLRWNTPLPGLAVKATYFDSSNPGIPLTFGSSSFGLDMTPTIQVYSAEYTWNNLTLTAEYQTISVDIEIAAVGVKREQRAETYYLMGTYRFIDWLEAGVYYNEYFPDASDKDGDASAAAGRPDYYAWQKDAAAFVRFDLNNYVILKLEGHYVDGVSNVLTVDNPTRDDQNWWYFATKLTFSF